MILILAVQVIQMVFLLAAASESLHVDVLGMVYVMSLLRFPDDCLRSTVSNTIQISQ
jgi:hypothetical protein